MTDVRAYGTSRIIVRTTGGQRERDEAGEQQGDRQVSPPPLPSRQHVRSSATLE